MTKKCCKMHKKHSNKKLKKNIKLYVTLKHNKKIKNNIFIVKDDENSTVKIYKNVVKKNISRRVCYSKEINFYNDSHFVQDNKYFPTMIKHTKKSIILSYLGPDLKEIMQFFDYKKLDEETICSIGIDLIEAIEIIHNLGYCHNDLKPDNMTWNFEKNRISIIDFDHVIKIKSSETFYGNTYYRGLYERDEKRELESIFYVLVELYCGLPWKESKSVEDKMKYFSDGCLWKNYVEPFSQLYDFWEHIKNIEDTKIVYEEMIDIFKINKRAYRFCWENNQNFCSTYVNKLKHDI